MWVHQKRLVMSLFFRIWLVFFTLIFGASLYALVFHASCYRLLKAECVNHGLRKLRKRKENIVGRNRVVGLSSMIHDEEPMKRNSELMNWNRWINYISLIKIKQSNIRFLRNNLVEEDIFLLHIYLCTLKLHVNQLNTLKLTRRRLFRKRVQLHQEWTPLVELSVEI